MAKLATVFLILISCFACGRYADFTLPQLPSGQAQKLNLSLNQNPLPVLPTHSEKDVLNPSVLFYQSQFFNFYSEFDGHTWHSAQATSPNGTAWIKEGRFLSPDPSTWEGNYIAANGSALRLNDRWSYWYVAGPRDRPAIGFVYSSDRKLWKKHPAPILQPGPRGSFDEFGVADPYVIQIGNWLYMYYLGQNRAREQQLGLARSSATGPNAGFIWEKLRSNPILKISAPGSGALDENGLGEPAVWQDGGQYWMLFTGRGHKEQRALGLARSLDGVNWVRLFDKVFRGQSRWNSQVLCDPAVLVHNNPHNSAQSRTTLVWFGGGDVARPDENIHGQIGAGELMDVSKGNP
jgi:predicted GH43/DUF377 family glycosyl hydrolase